jgi:hypothetical protein
MIEFELGRRDAPADFSLKRPNFLVGHGLLAPAVCADPVFRESKAAGRPGAKGSLHND